MRRSVIITVSLAACLLASTLLAQGTSPQEPGRFPADVVQASQTGTELAQRGSSSLVDRLKAIRGEVASEHSGGRPSPSSPATAPEPEPEKNSQLRSVLKRRGSSPAAPIVEPESGPQPRPETPGFVSPLDAAPITEPVDGSTLTEIDSSRRTARRPRNSMPTFTRASTPYASASSGTQLTLSSQGPAMRVETEGPRTIAVGKPASYRVRLINQSDQDAGNVVVYVTVPNGVELSSAEARLGDAQVQQDSEGNPRVAWKMDQVSGHSQHELAVTLEPQDNRPIELRVDWAFRPASLTAQIEVQQPQLAVDIQGPTDVQYGEAKIFKIQISNPGNGPAENVVVNLQATGAAGQPNTIGTIAAGETREIEIELTALQSGIMKIDAAANGDGGLQARAALEVMVRRAELAIDVRAPEMVFAGTDTTYTIHVANRGDATAKGVILGLNLPEGLQNGVGIDQKPITSDQPRWRLGDLDPGTERAFTLQCQLTTAGQNRLTINATGEGVQASTMATTQVEAIADLKLYVNDPKGPVPVGQDVVYEVKVVNRGTKAANNIELVAQFSDGIEPTGVSGHRSEIVPGQVLFETIRTLPAGSELTVKITARAAKDGNLRFRAELTCADSDTKLVSEESTRFYQRASGAASQTADGASQQPTPARR